MKKTIDQNDDVCTTKKVAEILGVTQRTVLNWVEEGKLTSWKTMGGHRRFSESMVRDLSKRIRLSKVPKKVVTHEVGIKTAPVLSVKHQSSNESTNKSNKNTSKYHILVIGNAPDKIGKIREIKNIHLVYKEEAYSGLIEVTRNVYDMIIICLNDSIIENITPLLHSLINDLNISYSKLLLIKPREGMHDQCYMDSLYDSDETECISAVVKTLLT